LVKKSNTNYYNKNRNKYIKVLINEFFWYERNNTNYYNKNRNKYIKVLINEI